MKSNQAAAAILVLAAWAASYTVLRAQSSSSQPAPRPSETRSVWDGVYTEEQARRGESLYSGTCSSCHGDKLKGNGSTPALTGDDFASDWNGLTLDGLFDKIRRTMPHNKPGQLSRQQAADVLAYILSFNKFPGGKAELPPENDALKLIRFQPAKSATKENDK